MEDTYKDLERLVKKELRSLIDKNSMNPSELDAAKKAVCLLKMLEDDYDNEEMAGDPEFSEAAYRNRSLRRSMARGRSYGYGYDMEPEWDDMAYESMRGGSSRARGRDSRTGRYVSRGGQGGRSYGYGEGSYESSREGRGRSGAYGREGRSYGYGYGSGRRMPISYDDGYSGHSIDDRIVDVLEQMMDDAASNYEREKLNEVIRYVDSRRGQ